MTLRLSEPWWNPFWNQTDDYRSAQAGSIQGPWQLQGVLNSAGGMSTLLDNYPGTFQRITNVDVSEHDITGEYGQWRVAYPEFAQWLQPLSLGYEWDYPPMWIIEWGDPDDARYTYHNSVFTEKLPDPGGFNDANHGFLHTIVNPAILTDRSREPYAGAVWLYTAIIYAWGAGMYEWMARSWGSYTKAQDELLTVLEESAWDASLVNELGHLAVELSPFRRFPQSDGPKHLATVNERADLAGVLADHFLSPRSPKLGTQVAAWSLGQAAPATIVDGDQGVIQWYDTSGAPGWAGTSAANWFPFGVPGKSGESLYGLGGYGAYRWGNGYAAVMLPETAVLRCQWGVDSSWHAEVFDGIAAQALTCQMRLRWWYQYADPEGSQIGEQVIVPAHSFTNQEFAVDLPDTSSVPDDHLVFFGLWMEGWWPMIHWPNYVWDGTEYVVGSWSLDQYGERAWAGNTFAGGGPMVPYLDGDWVRPYKPFTRVHYRDVYVPGSGQPLLDVALPAAPAEGITSVGPSISGVSNL